MSNHSLAQQGEKLWLLLLRAVWFTANFSVFSPPILAQATSDVKLMAARLTADTALHYNKWQTKIRAAGQEASDLPILLPFTNGRRISAMKIIDRSKA
ncbi:MAG: hypothetical protein C4532_02050 [Candidatus Abyssobacteria bacterium SURF_17]|uniref:Uncharacterized protein n=1 Tax=Candidatus Abyssobacteria bacterium SURF_17 TaxID=2093361 RepID=A0A419F868_9BACT|nr:MAG: hypothetical protein C4532_02050 [Candidatus Abyssubacteria bacterium SURF_17]